MTTFFTPSFRIKSSPLVLLAFFALGSCQNANTQNSMPNSQIEKTQKMKETNTEKVKSMIRAVNARDTATLQTLIHPDYIQHNPYIPTGRAGFLALFPILEENGTQAETVRIFQDGDFVVMHNLWKNATPFGAEEMVSFDVLRIDEDGQIAEHWDALQPVVKETSSGRSQIDGPTEITDLDRTAANKALAVSLVEDVLMGKNPGKITDHISAEQYHQHNPQIKDGLSGIMEAVEYLTSQNNMFKYTKIHKVLGEGNFVLTISEGEWGGKQQAFYDLFRMENGKIVEHWDVIQAIPSENLANDNTMFNF
jgi:predicted SnoaL-like aldol condensation-catalyzing enzyme